MKANKFFAVALATLALVACDKNNQTVEVEKVELDQKTLTLEEGQEATLVATVTPQGAATVAWTVDDESIVTVVPANDGLSAKVLAAKEGQTIVTATAGSKSARCIVKVGAAAPANPFEALLQGKNYYVFNLGETAFESIKDKVKGDFRINGEYVDGVIPEEVTCVLEIWGNTFGGGAGGGLNCFGHSGENDGYISLVSQTGEGWGLGCGGLRVCHRTVDLTAITGDYVLAIVYKTPANNAQTTAKFTLYSTTATGAEVAKEVSGNTNGEWTLVEYKMADLFGAGLEWSTPWDETVKGAWYSLGLLINGVGNGLDIDAAFVYEK